MRYAAEKWIGLNYQRYCHKSTLICSIRIVRSSQQKLTKSVTGMEEPTMPWGMRFFNWPGDLETACLFWTYLAWLYVRPSWRFHRGFASITIASASPSRRPSTRPSRRLDSVSVIPSWFWPLTKLELLRQLVEGSPPVQMSPLPVSRLLEHQLSQCFGHLRDRDGIVLNYMRIFCMKGWKEIIKVDAD